MQRSSSKAGTITEIDGSVTIASRVPAPDIGSVLVWYTLRSDLLSVGQLLVGREAARIHGRVAPRPIIVKPLNK
jgi:hypothetical protein